MPARYYVIDHKRRVYADCSTGAGARNALRDLRRALVKGIRQRTIKNPISPGQLRVVKWDNDPPRFL